MVNPSLDGDAALGASVTALREAWAAVLAELHAVADPQRRFRAATELGNLVKQLEADSADERARAALAIQESESLTLTALGERISMSKQRAGKLTEKARRARGSDDG